MEIKLIRTEKTTDGTFGKMYCDDCFFGYTIENIHSSVARLGENTAISEGVYSLNVRVNPMSGTPCVKVLGKGIPANTSIRCCNSPSMNNSSITLVSDEVSSGDYKETDVEAWGRLFDCLLKNRYVSLVIE